MTINETGETMNFRQNSSEPSELVVGVIGPIGCNRKHVTDTIKSLAKHFDYRPIEIGMSNLIRAKSKVPDFSEDQYLRVKALIQAGNELRRRTGDNSVLAKLAAQEISKLRPQDSRRNIFVIDSIKHPEEVDELRHIYGSAFYLFAVHSPQTYRDEYLKNQCHIPDSFKRAELIEQDKDEQVGYGQSTREAFHRADFFLTEEGNHQKVWNTLERFFDIIFGNPFATPTFHEYAMFSAYGAAMHSADLSRQVGAVVANGTDILSTGANDCPKPFGGTYWPTYDRANGRIFDLPKGRDYMRGVDRNAQEKQVIIDALKQGLPEEAKRILEKNILRSSLNDLTEFGRVVHAEMDAILSCARRGVSCNHASLFCTTFPCHNCAKHIVASGIRKVVFIEPYPKSKAFDMHDDAIAGSEEGRDDVVKFVPFVGVGPRQFVDLFSMTLSSGARMRRKASGSMETAKWTRQNAIPRVKAYPVSYQDNERTVTAEADVALAEIEPVVVLEPIYQPLV